MNEIFGYSGNEPFAGLLVIVCGIFFRLPPVKGEFGFISRINKIREGEIVDHVENTLKSRCLKEKSFLKVFSAYLQKTNQQKIIIKDTLMQILKSSYRHVFI